MDTDSTTVRVRLALHLAINDTSALSLAFDQNLQRMYEADAAQIVRMNDWLAEHAPDFYRMPGDTATAVIAALEAKDEHIRMLIQNSPLIAAQNEAAMLRQQLALSRPKWPTWSARLRTFATSKPQETDDMAKRYKVRIRVHRGCAGVSGDPGRVQDLSGPEGHRQRQVRERTRCRPSSTSVGDAMAFHRDGTTPIIYDYVLKGHMKEMWRACRQMPGSASEQADGWQEQNRFARARLPPAHPLKFSKPTVDNERPLQGGYAPGSACHGGGVGGRSRPARRWSSRFCARRPT